MSAESYIKRVFYRSCLKEPSITDYPINSIDRILFILDMEYPVLTEQEFLDVRNGFLSSLNSGTHSHHASRVQRYGAAISSYAVDHGGGDVYSEVDPALSSFLNNEPKELAVFELQNGIGVTFSQFTRPFDDHFTFSEAVNCSSKCWVGREKNGGASIIEIVGKEENLTEVRMMTRVALPDEQSANQREQYVNNIGYMARFFLSANRRTAEMSQEQLDEGGVMSDVLKKMTDARDVALQCGVATDVYQLDGLLHEIRTISRGGWMQVSISKGTDG